MFSISDIVSFIHYKNAQLPTPENMISDLIFDSRRVIIVEKTLFFAIKTDKNDGHNYIPSLIEKGVRNFIITQNIENFKNYDKCNFIQVTNTIETLQEIAQHHRKKFNIPVIGITGSNGKTIVKEWLYLLLNEDYYIIKSPNSYNSQIGVPISVFQINNLHQLAIFEAGISHPQEMEKLATIIQPTLGILTNIGSAHSQFFTDNRQKLIEKLKLFTHCKQLIYCSDYKEIEKELQDSKYQHIDKISWGTTPSARFQITHKQNHDDYTEIALNGYYLDIPFTDKASIENTIQVIICLHLLGYSFSQINKKLVELTHIHMRMEIKEAMNQSIVINDTYSLDFNSLKIAIDFLNSQKQFINKTIIISDFKQTQPLTEENYCEIAQLLSQNEINRMLAVGETFQKYRYCFERVSRTFKATFYNSTEALLQEIPNIRFQNEAILIKGARSFRFERITNLIQSKTHQTVLDVNLSSMIHNLDYYRSLLQPSVKVVAMVKAFSYGLGDAEFINELQYHNVDYLAVAYGDEGVLLRKHHIKTPIIILGAEAHSFDLLIRYQLEPTIFNFHYLTQLENILQKHPSITDFKIHIKFDTGMHRLGFDIKDIPLLIQRLQSHPQIKIVSIFSHLASAEDEKDDNFTLQQIALFEKICQKFLPHFDYSILRHLLNSAGISRFPQAHYDMVRLGIGLYGFSHIDREQKNLLHPVTLKTIITQIKTINKGETVSYNRTYTAEKNMQIGVIPIGYADGLFRELSNGVGQVLVHQQLVPIVGKICMDMCMIDLSNIKNVHIGDEVIIYSEKNPINEIASRINKSPYELLTAISKRVPRIYVME